MTHRVLLKSGNLKQDIFRTPMYTPRNVVTFSPKAIILWEEIKLTLLVNMLRLINYLKTDIQSHIQSLI